MSRRTRRTRNRVLIYAGYLVALVVFFLPFGFMLWSSFRSSIDITAHPLDLGSTLSLDNFTTVFSQFAFAKYALNSLIVAGASTVLGVVLGAPAAYVIVRLQWHRLGFVSLVMRMAPGVMFLVPLFVFSLAIGAPSDTALNYVVLILAHMIITLPLSIWLIIPFVEALPASIDEAAMVDGASVLRRFTTIVVPLISSGIAVTVTLSFIFSWNYFLFALALSNSDTMTLPVIAFSFIGEGQSNYGGLMAAATLLSLPALILAITAQRWLVRGLTGGAVK